MSKIEFTDKANGLYGWYEPGNVKRKTQDYFSGEITKDGHKISEIYGNYMGYMSIDGKRYWDIRELDTCSFMPSAIGSTALPSDSLYRKDALE
jgi:hypothetical protein